MDVLMPQLGETVAEGKITKWFVAAGATVKPGDNLFEIETDKVSMEVPSITAGVLADSDSWGGPGGRSVGADRCLCRCHAGPEQSARRARWCPR